MSGDALISPPASTAESPFRLEQPRENDGAAAEVGPCRRSRHPPGVNPHDHAEVAEVEIKVWVAGKASAEGVRAAATGPGHVLCADATIERDQSARYDRGEGLISESGTASGRISAGTSPT